MAVGHSPAGFTGTVDQVDEARRFALGGGGRFRVNGSGDWALTAHATVNRTVNIAAGMAVACGVQDLTTATDSVAFAANAGGSDRFDAVVATFDRAAMTITFRVIQGTTVVPTIVKTGTTVDTTKINWLPGTRYDAVLGVIRVRPGVTILAPADLYDCRPWGSWQKFNVISGSYGGVVDADLGSRMMELSTGRLWEWSTTGWFQVGGAIWQNVFGAYAGFSTPGASGQGLVTVGPSPAHAPGLVRVKCSGEWQSGGNAAGDLYIAYGNSSSNVGIVTVPGSICTTHSHNLTSPIFFTCDGYFYSDGAPKWFWILGNTSPLGGGFQVEENTWAMWQM